MNKIKVLIALLTISSFYTNAQIQSGNKQLWLNNDNLLTKWKLGTAGDATNNFIIYDSNNSLIGQGARFLINENTGNVGIGTITPKEKLEVNGNILASSNLITNSLISLPRQVTGLTNAQGRIYFNAGGPNNYGIQLQDYDEVNGVKTNLIIGGSLYGGNALLVRGANNVTKFFINNEGNVGIGTTNPEGNLQIGQSTGNGMIFLGGGKGYSGIGSTRSDGGLVLGYNIYSRYNDSSDNYNARVAKTTSSSQGYSGIKISQQGVIDFFGYRGKATADDIANTDENIKMRIDKYGNIGIGTLDSKGYKLGVNGKIITEEVKVALYANWSDFVFDSNYNLPTLVEVENHIKEKGHLKDIPSAKEVAKEGFYLAEMNAKLLQKIEELTLYTIGQEKELKSQREALANQNRKIESLMLKNDKLKTLEEQLKSIENRLNKK